jgi:endonuclease YncB( thermonuclease family)
MAPPRPAAARALALWAAAACVFAAAQAAQASPQQVVSGQARVVDGDTLVINDTKERIRLYGVDAPESKQLCTDAKGVEYACGVAARDALAERVAAGGGRVSCRVRERDQYGRLVASCALPRGAGRGGPQEEEDAGDFMVRRGQAVAYRKITPAYVAAEDSARRAKAGIWQGEFEPPAKWRYERRVAEGADAGGERGSSPPPPSFGSSPSFGGGGGAAKGKSTSSSSGGGGGGGGKGGGDCLIKGNISKGSGAKIYHVPGDPTYDATKINLQQGERYFCSEEEAERAGWRASQRAPSAAPESNGAGRRRR